MQITPAPPRTDGFDLKEMRDLVGSRAWGRIRQRLDAELERQRGLCERAEGTELHRAQGGAAALRMALATPALLLKEIEAATK
jgi:hypothetical protein